MAEFTIGLTPVDAGGITAGQQTNVNIVGPSGNTGFVIQSDIWAETNITGMEIGTVDSDDGAPSGNPEAFTPRGWTTGAALAAATGSAVTHTDPEDFDYFPVSSGDYAAVYCAVGRLETNTSGSAHSFFKAGNQFASGSQSYSRIFGNELSLEFTADTVEPGGGDEVVQIAAAGMALAGQALVVNASENIAVPQAGMLLTGQTFNINKAIPVAAASIVLAGQSVVANVKTVISIAQAGIALAGQAFLINEVIGIGKASIVYLGKTFTIAGEVIAALRRSWTAYIKRRRLRK